MHASIVVPTFRRPSALRLTLDALASLDTLVEYEVIVVDDGSDDATKEVAEGASQSIPSLLYFRQVNRGVASARNLGARRAAGDLLVFLDDDMLVAPDHLERHLAAHEAHGPCLVNGHWEFASWVLDELRSSPFGRFRIEVEEWIKAGIAKTSLDADRSVSATLTACNLSVTRALFNELGGFDEAFPAAGAEDQEFSYRAARTGATFVYDRTIRLEHNDQRTDLRGFCRRQQQGARTSVFLAVKHPELVDLRPFLREGARIGASDGAALVARKLIRAALSTRVGLMPVHAFVAVIERTAPRSRALGRAYWFTCGLYIFRGVRDGIAEAGEWVTSRLSRGREHHG